MRVKNWSKFQHFKDRRPPWIKLYRELLDDIQWHELDPVASKTLVSLWLIASEYDGELPDTKTLAFRLRTTERQLQSIVSKLGHWLGQDDVSVMSEQIQPSNVSGHQETETYKEETETEPRFALPDWVPADAWTAWLKSRKAKATDDAKRLNLRDLEKLRDAGDDPRAVLEQSTKSGWAGLFPLKNAHKNGNAPPWWSSDAGIEAKARELGVVVQRGESWQQLKGRINERINSQ